MGSPCWRLLAVGAVPELLLGAMWFCDPRRSCAAPYVGQLSLALFHLTARVRAPDVA